MAGLLTGLGGFNNTSLPWPLKSSRDFAETPAHYPVLHIPPNHTPETGVWMRRDVSGLIAAKNLGFWGLV
jgi:hypothetical protein